MSGTSLSRADVEDTFKDFWASRPRRPRQGRKLAGVAAAVGNRYGIDPTIVRVVFVVATFYGGVGLLLYVLGILFFAEEGDSASPVEALLGRGRSSASKAFTAVLAIALLPLSNWFVDFDVAALLGFALCLGGLFLLHRHRSHLGRPVEPTPSASVGVDQPMTQQTQQTYQPYQPTAPTWDPAAPTRPTHDGPTDAFGNPVSPPAWDPLGAAPFAWDLPEPQPEPGPPPAPRPKGPRSKAGLVTIGAAFLAVGAAVLLQPHLAGWVTAPHVIGVVLAILGLGMVGGSFRRGGRGLIGLAVPLSVVGIAMTVVWPNGVTPGGVGDIVARPTTLEQVEPSYQRNVGSIDLDLTALPSTGSVSTDLRLDVGDITVVVPPTADVTVRCATGVGDVDCLQRSTSGVGPKGEATDLGDDGVGGLKIDLDLRVGGPGSVSVRRG